MGPSISCHQGCSCALCWPRLLLQDLGWLQQSPSAAQLSVGSSSVPQLHRGAEGLGCLTQEVKHLRRKQRILHGVSFPAKNPALGGTEPPEAPRTPLALGCLQGELQTSQCSEPLQCAHQRGIQAWRSLEMQITQISTTAAGGGEACRVWACQHHGVTSVHHEAKAEDSAELRSCPELQQLQLFVPPAGAATRASGRMEQGAVLSVQSSFVVLTMRTQSGATWGCSPWPCCEVPRLSLCL